MKKKKYNKIIAVSGGVDSMFLLNKFRNENIIVAHVNYNIRDDTKVDQKIITDFCKKNNLKLEILKIEEKYSGNFQNWARIKRYEFFKKIYDEYECDELIIAHHKDDFLETALMQWLSKRNPSFYGIKKNNNNFEMNIFRPIIFDYWKEEIYQMAKEKNIFFNDDYTNFINQYQRNILRNKLRNMSLLSKTILFESFQKINLEKSVKNIEIIKQYYNWMKNDFNIDFLIKNGEFIDDLIFKFLIDNFKGINISKNILNSLKNFLLVKNGNKIFILSNNHKISKLNNSVIII